MTRRKPDAPLTPAYVADYLGVTRSAVGNWASRDILPEDLKPERVKVPSGKDRPQWRESQLPGLQAWLAAHHPVQARTFLLEVPVRELKAGDRVISVSSGLSGPSILVRRKLEKS